MSKEERDVHAQFVTGNDQENALLREFWLKLNPNELEAVRTSLR